MPAAPAAARPTRPRPALAELTAALRAALARGDAADPAVRDAGLEVFFEAMAVVRTLLTSGRPRHAFTAARLILRWRYDILPRLPLPENQPAATPAAAPAAEPKPRRPRAPRPAPAPVEATGRDTNTVGVWFDLGAADEPAREPAAEAAPKPRRPRASRRAPVATEPEPEVRGRDTNTVGVWFDLGAADDEPARTPAAAPAPEPRGPRPRPAPEEPVRDPAAGADRPPVGADPRVGRRGRPRSVVRRPKPSYRRRDERPRRRPVGGAGPARAGRPSGRRRGPRRRGCGVRPLPGRGPPARRTEDSLKDG